MSNLEMGGYLGGNMLGQHCRPPATTEEGDLVLGGRLDEWGHHPPEAVEEHGGVEEPQLREALREVLLQDLEHGLKGLRIQVPQAYACDEQAASKKQEGNIDLLEVGRVEETVEMEKCNFCGRVGKSVVRRRKRETLLAPMIAPKSGQIDLFHRLDPRRSGLP